MELSKEYLALKEKITKDSPEKTALVVGNTAVAAAISRKLGNTTHVHVNELGTRAEAVVVPEAPLEVGAGKRVKHVVIEATFPELKGGKMYQSAHGEASGTKPAIARAFRELLKKIPGKRVSVISARISITTKTVPNA